MRPAVVYVSVTHNEGTRAATAVIDRHLLSNGQGGTPICCTGLVWILYCGW